MGRMEFRRVLFFHSPLYAETESILEIGETSYCHLLLLTLCRFKIVQGLQLDEFSSKMIAISTTELEEERAMAQTFLNKK